MKKTNLIFLVLFITTIFFGCLEPTTPTAVFRKVYKAAEKNDIDTVLKYSTSNSSFSSLDGFYRNAGNILFVRENIDGDTAVVEVGFEYLRTNSKFELKKIDGQWKYFGRYLPEFENVFK